MDVSGQWLGYFAYAETEIWGNMVPNSVPFEIELKQGWWGRIKGTVKDDVKQGGSKGIGTIKGHVKKHSIEFVKQMPFLTIISLVGKVKPRFETFEYDQPHMPIYYKGTFNDDLTEVNGTWELKADVVTINGQLFPLNASRGTWRMKR